MQQQDGRTFLVVLLFPGQSGYPRFSHGIVFGLGIRGNRFSGTWLDTAFPDCRDCEVLIPPSAGDFPFQRNSDDMEKMTMLEFGEPVVMAYLQRINLFQSYASRLSRQGNLINRLLRALRNLSISIKSPKCGAELPHQRSTSVDG